jgi:DTW domain-containing protein YfiP
MHHREAKLTTNTAHLASLLLPRCEIHIRGEVGRNLESSEILDPRESPLLLYPSEQTKPLTEDLVAQLDKPVCLIVPDGSWRQASKVAKREGFLASVPHVTLNHDAPTRYLLRREPKAGGLATFEAIARALGVINGPQIRIEMEKIFALMVDRTLRSREGRQPIEQ